LFDNWPTSEVNSWSRRYFVKPFLKTLLHAALGGFSAGIAAYTGGSGVKSLLLAGVASAATSAISLLTKSPAEVKASK
jgi:hypothetical protein